MFDSKPLFQAVSDAAQDAIIIMNEKGKIIYWNPSAERIFGFTQKEVFGKDLHLTIAPAEYHKSYQNGFKHFVKTGKGNVIGKTLELKALKKDGTTIIIELSVSSACINGNWHSIGIIRDISERKNIENKLLEQKEALQRNEERLVAQNEELISKKEKLLERNIELQKMQEQLQNIYDGMIDGVLIADMDTMAIIHCNKALSSFLGYKEKELLKMKVSDLYPEDEQEELKKRFDINIAKKIKNKVFPEITCIRKDGSYVKADVVSSILTYNNKLCKIGFFRDATERLKAHKIKENFIATLSHDLRVPLLAENNALKYLIKGFYGKLTDTQNEATQKMLNSNSDLLNLVNNLLDVYKYDSVSPKLFKEDVCLYSLVNDCISELDNLAKDDNKAILSKIPENFIPVKADKLMIRRVLSNLIGNSLSYSHKNSIITIDAQRNEQNATISITDKGFGIPEDDLEKIFDIYYTSSKKFRKIGTGLGLYISKKIINSHGGKIWVNSKLEEGSTFYFTLPLDS